MQWFYILALLPMFIGLILFFKSKRVHWWELVASTAAGFLIAATMHFFAARGMTADVETWSGYVTQTTYNPEWVEKWIEQHSESYECGTTDNPSTCWRYWTTTEYDTHEEHWMVTINFGAEEQEWRVSEGEYKSITKALGNKIEIGPLQEFNHGGEYYEGNQNSYVAQNRTGFIWPATTKKKFENRIKAAPSVFSFISVPTNVPVFAYPDNGNKWVSDRLLGTAKQHINWFAFDQLNARLGAVKKVNVIMVGFDSEDSSLGEYQRAKWVGGKKNDIVLCYGKGWTKVFGWSDSELCKRNLETLLLRGPINTGLLTSIEDEIRANYRLKDWKAFDYLSIQPRPVHFVVYLILMLVVQAGMWIWALSNDVDCSFRSVYRRW